MLCCTSRAGGPGAAQAGAGLPDLDSMSDVLARRLVEVSQLRGNFVLRSGETSSEYFDK